MISKLKCSHYFPTVVLFLMFVAYFGQSQTNQNIDSLRLLISESENDTDKLQNLLMITRAYKNTDPIQAINYANQSLKLSQELDNPFGQADALFEKSALYKSIGKLDSALYICERAIAISDSLNDSKRLADNIFSYSNIIRSKGETDLAFINYKKVLDIYIRLNDSSGIAKVYNGLGIIYKIRGILDSAAFYYQEAIKLYKRTGDLHHISAGMINLGKVYLALGDYENAKMYLVESIEFAQKFNRTSHLVIAYTNLGMVAFEENNFDLALDYYNQALPLSIQIQGMSGMANLYNNIGNIYLEHKEDHNKAYEYYQKALDIFRKMGHKGGLLVNLMNIAVIQEVWGNYDKALIINDTCLQLAKEMGELDRQKTIYQNIMAVYTHLGNYKKAFDYQTKYYELNDSIFNLEKTEIITDLALKYEKEKDQARILILVNENLEKDLNLKKRTNQRNIYLFSGSAVFVIFIFILIYYRQKTRKDQIIAQQKIQQLEEEKKYLAARSIVEGQEDERRRIATELHDGLGVLLSSAKLYFTSVKSKSPENLPIIEKASKLLEKASQDVRRISHNMMPGILSKYGLFEAIEGLFDEIDDVEGLNAKLKIQGEPIRLNENKEIMVYRIIQEMINNTLKHADSRNIRLQMEIQPGVVLVNYSDDGKGFDVEEKMNLKSFGINNIVSRVKFLGGDLKIESELGKGVKYFFNVSI